MPRARDHTLRSLGAGILAAWLTAPAAAHGPVNVFLMVSDGQGFHAVGATTLYRGAPPVYQDFPVKVAVQTHSASQPAGYDPGRMWSDFGWALRGATDSAAAATAMVSGIKVRDGQLNRSPDGRPLRTFFEDASRLGMATGAISSVPFAHATPAAAYAHSMSRNDYPAIAREGILGDWLDVLIGAGHPGHDVNGEPRQPEPGHYDHVGGLSYVLERAGKRLPVCLHEKAFGERYSNARNGRRFIGIPVRRERLAALGADFRWIGSEPLEWLPGVWLSGTVPRVTPFETGDAHLVAPDATSGCDCQDPLEDDMAIFCRTPRGLVVLGGCAHSGLVNMVRHGLTLTGCTRLHGWIGGTHLGPAGTEQQAATLKQLADFAPDFVAANHCTGFDMMVRLQSVFGDRFIPAFVGTEIVFEFDGAPR